MYFKNEYIPKSGMQRRVNKFKKCKLYNFIRYHNLEMLTVDIISIMCGVIVISEIFSQFLPMYQSIVFGIILSVFLDIMCIGIFYKRTERYRNERKLLKDRLQKKNVALYFYN